MRFNRILTITIGVAVLVALVAPMAYGSNMGFKLERPLNLVPGTRSLYFSAIPFYRSFQDIASSADLTAPQAPDSKITAADVLMDWYTNGDGWCPGDAGDNGNNFPGECTGSITLFTFNPDPSPGENPDQTFTDLTIRQGFNGIILQGTDFSIEDPSDPDSNGDVQKGYMVKVLDPSPNFPSIIVGSHNPDLTSWVLPEFAASRNLYFYSLPYHTTHVCSDDLLDAAWDETDDPKEIIILFTMINDPAENPSNLFLTREVASDLSGNPRWSTTGDLPASMQCGNNNEGFLLTPGNGYMIKVVTAGGDGQITIPQPHY